MKSIRKAVLKWQRVQIAHDREEFYSTKLEIPRIAAPLLRSIIGDEISENILVVHLDTKLRILGYHVAARGSVNCCGVNPADIFREPIASGATSIILSHNHPSDDPSPSDDDINLTKRIFAVGELLKISLIDHIIVTTDNYCSFSELGIFNDFRSKKFTFVPSFENE